MNHKQQLMTLIMSGIAKTVELEFLQRKKVYQVSAFIYQGEYFEAVVDVSFSKEKQKIPLEGIQCVVQVSEKEYRVDYEKESLILRAKAWNV